ncbi:hypothetical protein EDD22DRAFT_869435, partial [Suillus occidentalis]
MASLDRWSSVCCFWLPLLLPFFVSLHIPVAVYISLYQCDSHWQNARLVPYKPGARPIDGIRLHRHKRASSRVQQSKQNGMFHIQSILL